MKTYYRKYIESFSTEPLLYICKCSKDTYNHVSVPILPFSFRPLAGNNSAFRYKTDIYFTFTARILRINHANIPITMRHKELLSRISNIIYNE